MKIRHSVLVLLLLGCACSPAPRSFHYDTLEGDEALSCIELCRKDAESCLKDTQLEYESCLRQNFFPKKDKNNNKDIKDRACAPPDTYGCRLIYNACYDDCGGNVEPIY